MLANLVSGIIVALAQPVRIGDYVAIDEWEGTVEEVRLTYSYIRAGDNSRIVIPNEQLGSKVIRNFTIVDETSAAVVEFVVPAAAALGEVRREALDVAAAFSRGRSLERQPTLAVTELAADTVRLRLTSGRNQSPTPTAPRPACGSPSTSGSRPSRRTGGCGPAIPKRLSDRGAPSDPVTADPAAATDPARRPIALERTLRRRTREILGAVRSVDACPAGGRTDTSPHIVLKRSRRTEPGAAPSNRARSPRARAGVERDRRTRSPGPSRRPGPGICGAPWPWRSSRDC